MVDNTPLPTAAYGVARQKASFGAKEYFAIQLHLMIHMTSVEQPEIIRWHESGQAFFVNYRKKKEIVSIMKKFFKRK